MDKNKSNSNITPPTEDPSELYPQVPGIDYKDFQLSPDGLSSEKRKSALDKLKEYENKQKIHFLGYQANQKLDYENELKEYLNFHINNIGDPFKSGNFTLNSKFAERAVLDYFASLWNAQWPHQDKPSRDGDDWQNSYWGYILSMGSTEGNINALWNSRDYLGGKFILVDAEAGEVAKEASINGRSVKAQKSLNYYQVQAPKENPNAYTPIAFYSQDTHYSIVKAMRVLNYSTFNEIGSGKFECPLKFPKDYPKGFSEQYLDKYNWPLEVPSNEDGSIFIPALAKLVDFFTTMGYPVHVNFNYGTTFKGAYDDVKEAVKQLVPVLEKNNMYERTIEYSKGKFDTRTGFWFHVDGALGAAYMPFLEMALKENKLQMDSNYRFPIFDFRIKEIHSISMSGHKFIGAPWPCGIYMTKVKYQLQPPDDPMYIGSPDTTFAGSRNGFSALILWDYLSKNSHKNLVDKVVKLNTLASYVDHALHKLQEKIDTELWIERSPLALTIRFKQANPDIIFKYSLSGEELYVNGHKRLYSHIYIMEHVTKELIDELMLDLSKKNAFPAQEDEEENSIKYISTDAKKIIHIPHTGRGFK